MKQKVCTFKLPVDLVQKLEAITKDKNAFVISVLQQAIFQNIPDNFYTFNNTQKDQLQYHDTEYLNRYIDRLEAEIEFWKDKYEILQLEYYDAVKDSIKRLDSKFERIMYSIDESKSKLFFESSFHLPHMPTDVSVVNQNVNNIKKKDSDS